MSDNKESLSKPNILQNGVIARKGREEPNKMMKGTKNLLKSLFFDYITDDQSLETIRKSTQDPQHFWTGFKALATACGYGNASTQVNIESKPEIIEIKTIEDVNSNAEEVPKNTGLDNISQGKDTNNSPQKLDIDVSEEGRGVEDGG